MCIRDRITAIQGGLKGSQIVFHGNNKSDDELQVAYKKGVTIVIDNFHDIERLEEIIPLDLASLTAIRYKTVI